MKNTITKFFCAFLFLAGTFSGFALDIYGTAPTFTGPGADVFNAAVSAAFDSALNELRNKTKDIDTKPEDFIQAWGNSAIFASQGATQRAYGGYKLFSFTIGPTLGIQLPGDPFKIMDELDSFADKLNKEHDIKLGISPQIFNARLGINTSKFLMKNLYLGLHLGFIKLNGDDFGLDGFSYDNFSIGVTANYQLIPQIHVLPLILLWRGVNLGTGFVFQTTKINYAVQLDTYSAPISGTSSNLTLDPRLILDMNINTVAIPLEATTAVKLLSFLNIPVGVGVDLGFGKSEIKIGMDGKINVTDNHSFTEATPGKVSADAGGSMAPSFFNLKFMTGLGFNFGPVLIDIPVTFYADNGYSVGITVGAFW